MYEKIPNELKTLKQWCCYKLEPDTARPNKFRKTPKNAYTGGNSQSNNPETWSDYETAMSAIEKYNFDGIGFFFANGYFGVDIDGVVEELYDFQNGDDNLITEFIHTLGSYCETSVSGNGIHIICKGELPKGGRRKKNVEMYQEGRFFIMTGNQISDYSEIINCTETIKSLHEKYIGGNEPTSGVIIPKQDLNLSESEILDLIKNSKQARFFDTLYCGEWESCYTSQSDADMALANMLAFWCAKDYHKMDKIFRSSGLMREKWDRKTGEATYGSITLNKAIRDTAKVYESPVEYNINISQKTVPNNKIYSFDDTGNAERFNDRFGDVLRFNYTNKNFSYYDGRRWNGDDTGIINRLCDEVVEMMKEEHHLYTDDENVEKSFIKHVQKSRSSKSKKDMIKELQHRIPITPADFDRNKNIFNTPNGILNLRTGELADHDPKAYISKISTVECIEKSDCPVWIKFLDDIFLGDSELIRYIQKAIGYSLTGSTEEQCAFFCYGNGRNGKSTFLDAISDIMGDYACNIQPETIMVKQGPQGANSDVARLKGARFVTTVEPNEGVRLNEGLLKQLTGGDKVTARFLYGSEFEFTPEFKLWMGTNHKPIIRGGDLGIWRRIHLIPFAARIEENQIDKQLKYKLKTEYPAILKWAVDGALLWQREGLELPDAVKQAVNEYKSEMDVIAAFVEDEIIETAGETRASDVYHKYSEWANENNQYKMSSTKFGTEFGKKYEKFRKRDGFYYRGITLRSFASQDYSVKFGS